MPRRQSVLFAASVTAGVIFVDQAAKALAMRSGSPMATAVHNRALAFGVLSGPALLLVVGAIAMLTLFLGVVVRLAVQVGLSPIPPALICGGLLGNLADRVRLGAVRDFLVTPWAIVNVADL